ncbi:MAG: hypothetical protein ACTHW2_10265 [Tissierella sp.]
MISKFMKNYALQVFKNEDDIEVILYGLKILGTSILTAMVVLLSGIIVGQARSVIIYLCVIV